MRRAPEWSRRLPVAAAALLVALSAAASATAATARAEVEAPPAAQPSTWTGTANGEMTAQRTKTPLRHAYAVVVRPRGATADETRVVLSEEPVPLEVLEELLKRLPSFAFRGVEVVLDAGGGASAVFFHHDELPAGLEVREVAKLVPAAAEAGRLAGRVVFDDPGFSFGFDATFDAPVFRPAAKPSRAADPGLPSEEQAKAALEEQGLELTPGAFDRVVGEGDVEAVRLFLVAGMPATTGEPGGSVLETAVEGGHAEVVRALLAAGANPNGGGYTGRPLLAVAAEGQGADVVRALVAGGADVTRKGAGNATALHAAAEAGKLDNVEVLLAAGAKVTARTTHGWTALHSAVRRRDLPMVKRLIAAGSDVFRDRKELLELARSAKSPEVENAIRDAPATPKK
ncbi:MAG: ankyrin repeat domain-containing protein [Thermoanaerobaculia bacterium]